MRRHDRRIRVIAVFALLAALFAIPAAAYATDAVDPAPQPALTAAPAAEQPGASADSCLGADTQGADDQQDPAETVDLQGGSDSATPADATPASSADGGACATPDAALAADSPGSTASGPTATLVVSQANPDTRLAVESALKASKRQFDATAATLQRSIDQLTAIVRKLDAAGVNVSAARARLAEARTALSRARAAERITVARYRAVLGADDEAAAFASARASARSSNTLLERARIKVLTATKTLRAIVKNVTVQNAGASTDST